MRNYGTIRRKSKEMFITEVRWRERIRLFQRQQQCARYSVQLRNGQLAAVSQPRSSDLRRRTVRERVADVRNLGHGADTVFDENLSGVTDPVAIASQVCWNWILGTG